MGCCMLACGSRRAHSFQRCFAFFPADRPVGEVRRDLGRRLQPSPVVGARAEANARSSYARAEAKIALLIGTHSQLHATEHRDGFDARLYDLLGQHLCIGSDIGCRLALSSGVCDQHTALLHNRNEALGLHAREPGCVSFNVSRRRRTRRSAWRCRLLPLACA
jgi:hypothetical protein